MVLLQRFLIQQQIQMPIMKSNILEGYNNQYSEPKQWIFSNKEKERQGGDIKDLINGDLSDFAGRKIKFMLRAVSSQAVSSKWSDEITLTLPKGKLILLKI